MIKLQVLLYLSECSRVGCAEVVDFLVNSCYAGGSSVQSRIVLESIISFTCPGNVSVQEFALSVCATDNQ